MPNVRADELEVWSERAEAGAVLPELVRRLLWAKASPTRLDIRAEAGVWLPGADGIVDTPASGPFWPEGRSFWEMSTSAKVSTKANADYDKRTNEVDPGLRAETAYVAVTSRRWPGKRQWEAERTADWAAVRALDADDLAAWIAEAPAVGLWFAKTQLQKPVDEELDVSSYLQRWTNATEPPLPDDLPVRGSRTESADELMGWFRAPKASRTQVLTVVDDEQEEAIAFTVAALAAQDDSRARALVVTGEQAFRLHSIDPELVVVPTFTPAMLPPPNGARIILAAARHGPRRPGAIVLGRMRREELADALKEVGVEEGMARRIAHDAGGRLLPLQRLLQHTDRPDWTRETPLSHLHVLLLLGSWTPRLDSERAVVARFGVDPSDVERAGSRLVTAPGVPISLRQGRFVWNARGDAWALLAPTFSLGLLSTFEDVARDALGEDDPAFELDPGQRPYALFLSKRPTVSNAMREGIVEALLRLAVGDELLRAAAGPEVGSAMATRVISAILGTGWKRWASLDALLPRIAEAAPDAFLDRLMASLDEPEGGVAALLDQVSLSRNPYTGLLWALERLAWIPEYVDKVSLLLATLASRDVAKHNWVNRPLHSLKGILSPWLPQSAAGPDQRLAIVRRIAERFEGIGWQLALFHLQTHGISNTHPRPEFRSAPAVVGAQREAGIKQVQAAHALAMKMAGNRSEWWAELLERSWRFDRELGLTVLAALDDARPNIATPDVVWTALRRELHVAFLHDVRDDAHTKWVTRLHETYERYTPSDVAARVAWLFTVNPDLPEEAPRDFNAKQKLLAERRAHVARELLTREDGWAVLRQTAGEGTDGWPGLVAQAVIDAGSGDYAVERYLRSDGEATIGTVGRFAIALLAAERGTEWVWERVEILRQQGREEGALKLLASVYPSQPLWDLVEQAGEPLRSEYWRRSRPYAVATVGDAERAVRAYLSVGHAEFALVVAGGPAGVKADTALDVLEALAEKLPDLVAAGWRGVYDVEQLLERLDRDPDATDERVVALEMRFLGLTSRGSPNSRLYRTIGDHPSHFVELVCLAYRGEGDPPQESTSKPTEREEAAVMAAMTLLEGWRGYPGFGLSPEDRERRLVDWSNDVLTLLETRQRTKIAGILLGAVLARAPEGRDGIWPCDAARQLLEARRSPTLEQGLRIGKYNLRGVTTRALGAGGEQERELALLPESDGCA